MRVFAFLFLLACPLAAQVGIGELADGYTVALSGYQSGGNVVTLQSGNSLVVNPRKLQTYDPGGNVLAVHYDFDAIPGFPITFLTREMHVASDESFAIVMATSHFWRFPLPAAAYQEHIVPVSPAAFLFEDDQHLLYMTQDDYSAPVEFWRLDLTTNNTTIVGSIPLPQTGSLHIAQSMALDAVGNLYVATSDYPSPPGVVQVLRIDAANLVGPGTFGGGDATLLGAFPESGESLHILPDGNLLLATNAVGLAPGFLLGPGRIRRIDSMTGASELIVETNSHYERIAKLELVERTYPEAFAPFQPADTAVLRFTVLGSPFGGPDFQRMEIAPARPQLSLQSSGPGTLERTLEGGPANGFALIFAGPATLFQDPEPLFFVQGTPLFWGLDLNTFLLADGPFPLDAQGASTGTVPAPPPGFFGGQAVLLRSDLTLAGSSTAVFP